MTTIPAFRRSGVRLAALGVLGVAGVLAPLGPWAGAAAKAPAEDDQGVVVRFEGAQGTSTAELAIADGSMAKALAPLGATAEAVGNFTAEAPAVQAIEAGSLDIAEGSITATAGALAGGAPVTIFAYGPDTATSEAILVKKTSSIHSVKDLVGKTVAVNQAGSGQYVLLQALAANHVPVSSVHQDFLLAPAGNAAFQAGAVDAWATFATFIPLAEQNDDARVLVTGGQVHSANDVVYVAGSAFAKKYPHLLDVVTQVLEKESRAELKNPGAYDTALVTADKFAAPEVTYANDQLVEVKPVTPSVVKGLQEVADFFYKNGGIPTKVNVGANTVVLSKVK